MIWSVTGNDSQPAPARSKDAVQSLPQDASKQSACFADYGHKSGNTGGPVSDPMLEFVARENIIRFERHLSATSDDKE
jgi:hypothetical protein